MTNRLTQRIRRVENHMWLVLASLTAGCALAGCGLLEMEGDMSVRTRSMGTDYDFHYLPREQVTPIEPGTRFELVLREYCPDETNCREDEIRIEDLGLEQDGEVLVYHGNETGGLRDRWGIVELEAVGRGDVTMTVDFTRNGRSESLERQLEVVEPNGVGLKECGEYEAILYGDPSVTLLRSVLHDGRRMISNGFDPDAENPLISFDPPGALVGSSREDPFRGSFSKVEPGDFRIVTPHEIHFGDYYGYEPVERADGSLRYNGVELTSESELGVAVPTQVREGTEFPLDVDVDPAGDMWSCSDVHFEIELLTPDICRVEDVVRQGLNDPNRFSSSELGYPDGLEFEAHSRGTCQIEVTIPQPGRLSPTKSFDIDVLPAR